MRNDGCGYDSCPCRGVNFIVCGGLGGGADAVYCVDGKRVRIVGSEVMTSSASPEQVFKLEMYLLDRYASYLRWRGERPYVRSIPVSPFDYSLPLTRAAS
jgi:hypothetical protein